MANKVLRYYSPALLIALVILTCPTRAQSELKKLPTVRVVGNHFELDTGEKFVFRGLCFSDPDKLEKAGHWNRRYFEAAKAWHANVVRFPVHPAAWRERGRDEYFKLLDDGIQWATELGMYVIIDWHSIGNLRTELFQAPHYDTTKTETFRFWKAISERYQDHSTVACYELFNEPTRFKGKLGRMTWLEHRQLMEEIIAIIRAHDQSVIPLVGGFNWSYDLTAVRDAPIAFPGVAYVAHPYPQKRDPPWEEQWEADFGYVADTYPIIATEFGFTGADEPGAHIPVIGDETYGEAITNYFERKGISWTVWCFDPHWSPELIQDWNFTPTRQGRFFKAKLTELSAYR